MHLFFFVYKSLLCRRATLAGMLLIGCIGLVHAQMDTIHWIPPLYAKAGLGPRFIYLTTLEETAFPVVIRAGNGQAITSVSISRSQPFIYQLLDTYGQIVIPDELVGKPLDIGGLTVSGPKPFLATFRVQSSDLQEAGHLVCKGRAALGTVFRIGHIRQVTDKAGERSNFFGVMATEDSTHLTFSGFVPITIFTGWTQVQADGKVHITLQRGESVVLAQYIGGIGDDQPRNGFMGALLTASRPVAVNSGSWLGGAVIYQVHDMGFDQIVPYERVGKDYILCRGEGPTSLEHPIVIAHQDGTEVWVNGRPEPEVTLNAGEYWVSPTINYSPAKNMYIHSSKPVYVYLMTGGELNGLYSLRSGAFVWVPPLNCGLPHTAGPVYKPIKTGALAFDAGVGIVAQRDSALTLLLNGLPVPLPQPDSVYGNADFVMYRIPKFLDHTKAGYMNELLVESSGSVQFFLFDHYKDAGFSGLFSGFQTRIPAVQISLEGNGICPDTLFAHGTFDGIQWVYDGEVLQRGPDSMFIVRAPGSYKAVGYIGSCFGTATVVDSLRVPLEAPQFAYEKQDITCFGGNDGWLAFGLPNGGQGPYQYSIGTEQGFQSAATFADLTAGPYRLIVQDVSGCYNEPIHVRLNQPDSFYVDIVAPNLELPFVAGTEAYFLAAPSHPVSSFEWGPLPSDCTNCHTYTIRPDTSLWIWLEVSDALGCMASNVYYLEVDPRVFAPNVIKIGAANGNDRFSLFTKDPLPIVRLLIFDRWGNQVFENKGSVTNHPGEGWDARFRGKDVSPGVYTFFAELEVEPGRVLQLNGTVTVL